MTNPSPGALRPMSAGNVVSAGIQLYRDRLNDYLPLALVAYLWIFVPVYGWAKFYMIGGLISRLAFGELLDRRETVEAARAKVRSRLWSFLGAAFQVGIRLLGVYILGVIAAAIVGGILGIIFSAIAPILVVIPIALVYIALIIVLIRFFSRWFVYEVPLAVESNITGAQSVDRSWRLTETSIGRVQIVAVIGFLVMLPVTGLTGYLPSILFSIVAPDFATSGAATAITVIVSLAGGILVMPFWQVLKAVVYYDLCSRQEGLDLQLRDRDA